MVVGSVSIALSGTTERVPSATSSGMVLLRAVASHISGESAWNTRSPVGSSASAPLDPLARNDTPDVRVVNRTFASAGFAAAWGVLTTSTSAKPNTDAVTLRSTSGSTEG